MGLAQVQSYMTAAVAALRAGNIPQARLEAESALGELAAIPDSGHNGSTLAFNHQRITDFLKRLDSLSGAGASSVSAQSIRFTKVNPAALDVSGDE